MLKWGGSISLTPIVGDVLLDAYLLDRVKYIKSKSPNTTISFVTNGIKLHKVNIRELLTHVDKIRISLGGWSSEDYLNLYRVDKFNSVLENLELLFQSNVELNNKTNILVVFRVKAGDTEIRNSKIKSLLDKYPQITVQIVDNYDTWGGNIPIEDMQDLTIQKAEPLNGVCAMLYRGFQVLSNGRVVSCACRDYEGTELYIGDINKKSIGEIREGKELKELKKLKKRFLQKDFPDICENCTSYKPIFK